MTTTFTLCLMLILNSVKKSQSSYSFFYLKRNSKSQLLFREYGNPDHDILITCAVFIFDDPFIKLNNKT